MMGSSFTQHIQSNQGIQSLPLLTYTTVIIPNTTIRIYITTYSSRIESIWILMDPGGGAGNERSPATPLAKV